VTPVTEEPDRALPADPWGIQVTYRHRQPWWFDANSEPERWHVSADVLDDGDSEVVSHVADIDVVLVDIGPAADPFGVLDGEDADLGLVAEALFDPATSRPVPEFEELVEPAGERLLVLGSVRLAPQWRGFGLGVLLAGTAIRKLSWQSRLVPRASSQCRNAHSAVKEVTMVRTASRLPDVLRAPGGCRQFSSCQT
jgi:hypothetical protein